jgi:prevent-host-death family protein
MNNWQFHEAQAQLEEVIECAKTIGPQTISANGQEKVVVITNAMYEKLMSKQQTLVDFMQSSPMHTIEDIHLERDKSFALYVSI